MKKIIKIGILGSVVLPLAATISCGATEDPGSGGGTGGGSGQNPGSGGGSGNTVKFSDILKDFNIADKGTMTVAVDPNNAFASKTPDEYARDGLNDGTLGYLPFTQTKIDEWKGFVAKYKNATASFTSGAIDMANGTIDLVMTLTDGTTTYTFTIHTTGFKKHVTNPPAIDADGIVQNSLNDEYIQNRCGWKASEIKTYVDGHFNPTKLWRDLGFNQASDLPSTSNDGWAITYTGISSVNDADGNVFLKGTITKAGKTENFTHVRLSGYLRDAANTSLLNEILGTSNTLMQKYHFSNAAIAIDLLFNNKTAATIDGGDVLWDSSGAGVTTMAFTMAGLQAETIKLFSDWKTNNPLEGISFPTITSISQAWIFNGKMDNKVASVFIFAKTDQGLYYGQYSPDLTEIIHAGGVEAITGKFLSEFTIQVMDNGGLNDYTVEPININGNTYLQIQSENTSGSITTIRTCRL